MRAFDLYLKRCKAYGFFLPTVLSLIRVFEKKFNVGADVRQRMILRFMHKEFQEIIAKYMGATVPKEAIPHDSPIWFCWYQGEDGMPEIVKACLRSIKKYAGDHPVVVLDYQTIGTYVTFPNHIAERLEKSDFNLIYLSDYMRNYLLSEYGGIWFDTTIYALRQVEMPELPFWTVKRRCSNIHYVSRQRWTGFAMAGVKGNPLNSFVKEVLSEYHRRYPILIDHFLIDFTIALAYENVPCIREMIDQVSLNNENLYYLQDHIYDDYDGEMMEKLCGSHFVQKVHHRYKGCKNKKSYYYYIINSNIIKDAI